MCIRDRPKASVLGYNFVDTSDDYYNEEYIGNYIKDENLDVYKRQT